MSVELLGADGTGRVHVAVVSINDPTNSEREVFVIFLKIPFVVFEVIFNFSGLVVAKRTDHFEVFEFLAFANWKNISESEAQSAERMLALVQGNAQRHLIANTAFLKSTEFIWESFRLFTVHMDSDLKLLEKEVNRLVEILFSF